MVATAHAREGHRVVLLCTKAPWERVHVPEDLPYLVDWAPFLALRPGISSPLRFLNGLTVRQRARKWAGPRTIFHGNGDEASLLHTLPRHSLLYTSRYPRYDDFLHGMPWGSSPARSYANITLREPRFTAMALAMRNADVVTSTSLHSARDTEASFGLRDGSVVVVPNGIDPLFLEDAPPPAREAANILFFGRLTRAKGCDLLIQAWMRLPAPQRSRHPLVIVGDGPMSGTLRKMASDDETGCIRFTGTATPREVRRELSQARVAVLPSLEESFGNAMLETLASGTELLTTTAGSIPEVCGPWGAKIAPGNTESLASELSRILSTAVDPAALDGQRRWVKERYAWESTARRFRELAERPPGDPPRPHG